VGSLLPGLIIVLIEGDVDTTARLIGKLRQLGRRQLRADGAGGVAKPACQSTASRTALSPGSRWKTADGLPGKQAALGARQQTVGKCGADTAAVEVDDLAVLAAGKDHPSAEGIAAWRLIKPLSSS
jgi:hypothetical protein